MQKARSSFYFLLMPLLAVLFSLHGSASDTKASDVDVTIDNFTYTPQVLTVKVGTQITWTNHDDIPHTVVSDDAVFKSKTLDTDDRFTFTPSKPGTYTYFCSIHPKMTAKVVAQ